MSLKKFFVNSPANPFFVNVNSPQNLQYTIEFMPGNHPNSVTLRYDIDNSGKAAGALFSNGSTNFQQVVSTPITLNDDVFGSFTLKAGTDEALFGIDISVIGDSIQPANINVSLSNPSADTNAALMKTVDAKIRSVVKTAVNNHVKEMHARKAKKKA